MDENLKEFYLMKCYHVTKNTKAKESDMEQIIGKKLKRKKVYNHQTKI